MGISANPRISEEKGLFPAFSGFPRCFSDPPEEVEKGGQRVKKADFGRFPGRAARRLLSPHFLHPHLRQPDSPKITHLICARLKYDLYDFLRGCFGPVSFLFLV